MWTEKQKEAIDKRNSNILVSASAGSGKTAVLVERVINRVIDDNVQFERLAMLSNMNIYEGYCAETSLISLIDDTMSDCEVFNFKLEYQNDIHSYKISESAPCSTCTVNLGLHDATYKSIKK